MLVTSALAACGGSSDPGWMSDVPDETSLAALSIPGTHDSGAYYEPLTGVAKTQGLLISQQLDIGIRYFDIRCRNVMDAFLIYHGPIDQNQTFDEVLATMSSFLDAHPSETVIMSVKEEAMSDHATLSFEEAFRAYVSKDPERWVLGAAVPSLADARGKIVLLRRFPAMTTPLGIDAAPWADNATFTIDNGDAKVRVEDEYDVKNNDAKWTAITNLLAEARAGDPQTLYLDYTSGFQTMSAIPNIRKVNSDIDDRLRVFFADPANAHGRFGVLAMDFATAPRAAAIIATNH